MTGKAEHAWDRLAVGAWLGLVALAAGYLLIASVVMKLLEDEQRLTMRQATEAGASEAEQHLSEVIEDLRRRANDLASLAADGSLGTLPRLHRIHAPLVRALVEVTGEGSLGAVAPAGWPEAAALARDPTVARAVSTGTLAVSAPIALGDGDTAVVLALPVAGFGSAAAGAVRGALAAVIDLAAFRREYLEPLGVRPGGWGALFVDRGSVPVVVGGELPLRRPEGALGAGAWAEIAAGRLPRIEVGGESFLVSAPVGLTVGAERWTMVAFRPHRAVLGQARQVLLLSAFFVILAAAVGGSLALAWRRHAQALRAVRHDADHWHELATEVQREERWQVIAEEASQPIVLLRGSTVSAANLAAVEGLRLRERSGLLGAEFLEFVAAEDQTSFRRRLEALAAHAESTETFRCALVSAAGERRVVDMSVSQVPDRAGRLIRLSWNDLTSRERAEALLRTVSSGVPVGVALLDREGRLVWANSAFGTAVQQPVDKYLGHFTLPLVEPRERRRARAMIGRALRQRTDEGLLHVRGSAGEIVPLMVRAVPVNVAGVVDGVLAIGWDAAAMSPPASWAQLPDGVLLAQVGALITHRLSNDLQALVGLVGRWSEGGPPEAGGERTEALIARATHQIQQFAALSRMGAPVRQRIVLTPLIESWRARVAPGIPAGVRVGVRREALDDHVEADAAQIVLVLDLGLAAALPELEGGGVFEVGVETSPRPGQVRLTLFDTGTAAQRPAQPAARAPGSPAPTREMFQAVARLVARHHGGMSGVKATVGIGRRFWCDLAVVRSAAGAAGGVPERGAGLVLVADDEELVRAGLSEALCAAGYAVEEASDGKQVVDRVRGAPGRYALVVLDLVMPVMDGREALRQLRELAPDLPVLLCTGYDPADDPLLSGAAVAIKPLTGSELVERVAAMVTAPPGTGRGDGTMSQ